MELQIKPQKNRRNNVFIRKKASRKVLPNISTGFGVTKKCNIDVFKTKTQH